jgi:hypothetical protein
VAELQHGRGFEHRTQFGLEKAPAASQRARVGEKGAVKMGVRQTAPVGFEKPGGATGAAPFTMTAARFFGLDAGDWSMIFVGLALSGLFLALI